MLKNLINLFFPPICEACKMPLSDGVEVLCLSCRHDFPVTNFHFEDDDNKIKKLLYGRVELENATALFHFSKKGLVQEFIHNLKYRGHEQIISFLGKWLGSELKALSNYKDIDVVIPVPLHKIRERERGYNQVEKFGLEIARALQCDYNNKALVKTRHTATQVFKDRLTRFDDANTRFGLGELDGLTGKHLLLVDDIITTGAIIEACLLLLKEIPNVKLSVATMAITE